MSAGVISIDTVSGKTGLLAKLRALYERRETVRFLTSSNLKAGHRDKVLGNVWNVLDPLMFMLVYYFVFGVLFGLIKSSGGRATWYMLYIFVAVLMWRFIEGTISQGANCIRANRGLIHEINFPKSVFPVSVACSRLYDFLWGLIILFVFLLIGALVDPIVGWPTLEYLWLPLLLLVTFLFVLGIGFFVAYLGAFFADTTNVVSVAMRLLFYCSPIFYLVREKPGVPENMVILKESEHPVLWALYMSNPIASLMECYRDVLQWGEMPEPRLLLYVAGISLVLCTLGFSIFTRNEGKFAKYI
ncbi:MAG: ABC transporter permease [Planctomycetota bacterium]